MWEAGSTCRGPRYLGPTNFARPEYRAVFDPSRVTRLRFQTLPPRTPSQPCTDLLLNQADGQRLPPCGDGERSFLLCGPVGTAPGCALASPEKRLDTLASSAGVLHAFGVARLGVLQMLYPWSAVARRSVKKKNPKNGAREGRRVSRGTPWSRAHAVRREETATARAHVVGPP